MASWTMFVVGTNFAEGEDNRTGQLHNKLRQELYDPETRHPWYNFRIRNYDPTAIAFKHDDWEVANDIYSSSDIADLHSVLSPYISNISVVYIVRIVNNGLLATVEVYDINKNGFSKIETVNGYRYTLKDTIFEGDLSDLHTPETPVEIQQYTTLLDKETEKRTSEYRNDPPEDWESNVPYTIDESILEEDHRLRLKEEYGTHVFFGTLHA